MAERAYRYRQRKKEKRHAKAAKKTAAEVRRQQARDCMETAFVLFGFVPDPIPEDWPPSPERQQAIQDAFMAELEALPTYPDDYDPEWWPEDSPQRGPLAPEGPNDHRRCRQRRPAAERSAVRTGGRGRSLAVGSPWP
jgi:hypothetical protein